MNLFWQKLERMLLIAFILPSRWNQNHLCLQCGISVLRVNSGCLSALHHFILVHIPYLPLVFLPASSEDLLIRGSGTFPGFTKQFLWYPSSTCSFTSLDITATEAKSTEYKLAIEDHSLSQYEFVQKHWDIASIDGCNWCLIMKTGLTQIWKEPQDYQSGWLTLKNQERVTNIRLRQRNKERSVPLMGGVFKPVWPLGESSWRSLEAYHMGL